MSSPTFVPPAMPPGMENMVENMVLGAIRKAVREEVAAQMGPVNELVERINTLFDAGKESKNLLVRALLKHED